MSGAWNDFVTAALLGSGKSATPELPSALQSAVPAGEGTDKPLHFLTAAGAFALWRRAGWRPPSSDAEMAPAPTERSPVVSRASAAHLRAMLGGRFAILLPEWLDEAVRAQRRVPFELLPSLLEAARLRPELRLSVMAAGGARAEWLAQHNPQWSFATAETPDHWETGSRSQRLAAFRGFRLRDANDAREKLVSVWSAEPAEIRTALTAELHSGLSEADEPFLETLLDDRSKEVRRAAADLLARIPGSAFVSRMLARATPLLNMKPGKLLTRPKLEVALPPDPDAAALRDGVDPKAFGTQKTLGGKAVMLVVILSAIPLSHWTETFAQTPAALVQAVEKNEFARAVTSGWAWAALRQGDQGWAEALLETEIELHEEFLPDESLLALLPEDKRAAWLLPVVKHAKLKSGDQVEWAALLNQLAIFPGYLPTPLAEAFLNLVREVAADGLHSYFRASVEEALTRLPPSLLPGILRGWPMDKEGVPEISAFLTFRHDMLAALQPS